MSAWFSSDKPGSLESLQFQCCRRCLQCFFPSLVCVRACVPALDGVDVRTNWTARARRGGRFHGTTDTFSFVRFHTQRSAAPATDWRAAAAMAQVSPVWKVFKIHASISTPVRHTEDSPNSFHASTWQRANGKPLEGGLWGLGEVTGDWSLSITIPWTCQICFVFFNTTFIRYMVLASCAS